jgi:hypothetical protein
MDELTPYNPLAKRNLAASIVGKLLKQQPQPLPPAKFEGAGVYILYYHGDFEPYRKISNLNRAGKYAQPMYVGKAVPPGSRTGGEGLDTPHEDALHKRLRDHRKSIEWVKNLSIDDFRCRWLVVDEVFIHLGEAMLISHFKPLWNLTVDGFGNHKPGKGRGEGKKPMWDVIHPGRPWADGLKAAVTGQEVLALIAQHIKTIAMPSGDLNV